MRTRTAQNPKTRDTATIALCLQQIRRNEQTRRRTGRDGSCPLCAGIRQLITTTETGQRHLYCPHCGDLETLTDAGTGGTE